MDWSNLVDGPAGMIAERLLANDVADYVRFRAVCRPWRRCSADPRAHGILDRRFHPRRWIMLPEEDADPDRRRRLLNVSTGECVRAHLPELRGHDVCAPTVEGLLVLRNRITYAVRLLNPLTGHVADLPPATTLYPLYWCAGMYDADPSFDFKVVAAGLADDATVAVLFQDVQMLVVAKPGDEKWTLVRQGTVLWPAISFAGRFYCITESDIEMVDTRDNQAPRLVLAAKNSHQFPGIDNTLHLLDNDGELILLSRTAKQRIREVEDFAAGARGFVEYKASRVDLDARKTHTIHDLGGHAVFIGRICSISVSPLAFPTILNDSIYVGKDHVLGRYLESTGPYKLVDGTGTTLTFNEGSGATEACGFDNDDNGTVPRYGPHSIVDYLSKYVTRDTSAFYAQGYASAPYAQEYASASYAQDYTSASYAQDYTSDSDAEANCTIC